MSDDAKRICSNCENAYHGPGGVFCRLYTEDIPDETVAEECVGWDPLPRYQRTLQSTNGTESPEPAEPPLSFPSIRYPPPKAVPQTVDEVVAAPPSPELVAACETYLEVRHTVLWGQVFEVISPKGRAEAAEWLAQQITAINYVVPVEL